LTLRKPETLPPTEIDQIILTIIDANFGAGRDALIQAASRALEFASTSAQLRAVLNDRVDELVSDRALTEKGGLLLRTALRVA
jgi:hypothetical protein